MEISGSRRSSTKVAAAAASVVPFHCVICFDEFNLKERAPMVLPCGHTYVCCRCTKRLRRCMECREPLFVAGPKSIGSGGHNHNAPASSFHLNNHHHQFHQTHQQNNAPHMTTMHLPPSSQTSSSNNNNPNHHSNMVPLPIPKNVVLMAMMEAAQRQRAEVEKEAAEAEAESSSRKGTPSSQQEGEEEGDSDEEEDEEEEEEYNLDRIISGMATLSGPCGTYSVADPKGLVVLKRDPRTYRREEPPAAAIDPQEQEQEQQKPNCRSNQPSRTTRREKLTIEEDDEEEKKVEVEREPSEKEDGEDEEEDCDSSTSGSTDADGEGKELGLETIVTATADEEEDDVCDADSKETNANYGVGGGGGGIGGPTSTSSDPYILKMGQTVQVVDSQAGVFKLARGEGYICATAAQLVKVGGPKEACCRLEGLLDTIESRGRDLQSTLDENRQIEANLRRQIEAELEKEPAHPVIVDPPDYSCLSSESKDSEHSQPLTPTSEDNDRHRELRTPDKGLVRDNSLTLPSNGTPTSAYGDNHRGGHHDSPATPSSANSIDNADITRAGVPGFRRAASEDDLDHLAFGCGAAFMGQGSDISGLWGGGGNNGLLAAAGDDTSTRLLPRTMADTLMTHAAPTLTSPSFDGIDFRTGMSCHRGLSNVNKHGPGHSPTPRGRQVRTMKMSSHCGIARVRSVPQPRAARQNSPTSSLQSSSSHQQEPPPTTTAAFAPRFSPFPGSES